MDDDNPQIYWLVQSPNKSLINHHLSLHNHNPQNYIPIVKNSPFRRSSAHVLNHLTMGNIGKSPFRMVKSPPSPSIQPPFPLENNHLHGHWTQKKCPASPPSATMSQAMSGGGTTFRALWSSEAWPHLGVHGDTDIYDPGLPSPPPPPPWSPPRMVVWFFWSPPCGLYVCM